MARRDFISEKDSLKQPDLFWKEGLFWSGLAFVISLTVGDSLPILNKVHDFATGVSFYAVVIFAAGSFLSARFRDKVPQIKVPKMTIKGHLLAFMIEKSFTPLKVIDVLKISSHTKYGYEIPLIRAFVDKSYDEGWLAIENIGNNRLESEHILEMLSGSLTGKFIQKYSFIGQELTKDGNFYKFYFENLAQSKRFVVKNGDISPFLSKNFHHIRLSEDLIWKTELTPNMSLVARTRAGKTMLVSEFLIPLARAQKWDITYCSVKRDVYGDKLKGINDPEKIVSFLEDLIQVMKTREAILTRLGKSRYDQIDLYDICVVLDELNSFNAMIADDKPLKKRWENAINVLTSKAGSSGIHVISISQLATKDGFLPSRAKVNSLDAVIMLGAAADSADERKYLMPKFDIPKRNYLAGQGVARFVTSGKKWEQPHYYETPLIK